MFEFVEYTDEIGLVCGKHEVQAAVIEIFEKG